MKTERINGIGESAQRAASLDKLHINIQKSEEKKRTNRNVHDCLDVIVGYGNNFLSFGHLHNYFKLPYNLFP